MLVSVDTITNKLQASLKYFAKVVKQHQEKTTTLRCKAIHEIHLARPFLSLYVRFSLIILHNQHTIGPIIIFVLDGSKCSNKVLVWCLGLYMHYTNNPSE